MKDEPTKFRVKTHIMGGGLCLRQGQIVDESQLREYIELLMRAGAIEEIVEPRPDHTRRPRAYTA